MGAVRVGMPALGRARVGVVVGTDAGARAVLVVTCCATLVARLTSKCRAGV